MTMCASSVLMEMRNNIPGARERNKERIYNLKLCARWKENPRSGTDADKSEARTRVYVAGNKFNSAPGICLAQKTYKCENKSQDEERRRRK